MSDKIDTKEKTILMAINRGVISRNILRAGVLDCLLKDQNVRVVVVINTKIHDYFRKEFSHPRVILEEIPPIKSSSLKRYWHIATHGLVYTRTQHRIFKYGSRTKGALSKPKYFLIHSFFWIISKLTFLKYLARFIENKLIIERDYDYIFQKFQPDLVFCGSIYSHGLDFVLIKAARRLGVLSISMSKSWDTVGRLFYTAPSDIFILNNELMKERVEKEQLIPKERIYVSGFPQFDIYAHKKHYEPRAQFLKQLGLDPEKPTILYASNGEWTSWDHLYVKDLIDNYGLLEKYNLILRPHPTDMAGAGRYSIFKNTKGAYVDDRHLAITNMFGDKWDQGIPEMEWMAEIINVADVVVTFPSTFTLDSFVLGKPVINVYYDIEGKKSPVPLSSLYDTVHYNYILEENSVILARNAEEVLEWIEKFIKDPHILADKRKKTVDKICYTLDGGACKRISDIILESLT